MMIILIFNIQLFRYHPISELKLKHNKFSWQKLWFINLFCTNSQLDSGQNDSFLFPNSDPETPITVSEFGLGTSTRDTLLLDWMELENYTSITFPFHIPDGVPAWVRLRFTNIGKLWSGWKFNMHTYNVMAIAANVHDFSSPERCGILRACM